MIHTDLLSDMLVRIKNGQRANKLTIVLNPYSQTCIKVLNILYREGYIRGHRYNSNNIKQLEVLLKYHNHKPVIHNLKRISKPSSRRYCKSKDLHKYNLKLGITILSTPLGILSLKEAQNANVGGEILCQIW
nr:ribosomal protein S8 [Microheliella maris]